MSDKNMENIVGQDNRGADSDSNSSREEDWIFYRDRADWSDVQPVPQEDGEFPVVKIAYSDTFRDVYDYFRAAVAMGEFSERVLKLTEDALHLNAANYTVWQYRRKCLKALGTDLHRELDFTRDMIEQNPKNYQVWHHRRVVVEWSGDPGRELRLTAITFSQDAKNYHAWEHRQWVLSTYRLFDGELEFVDTLLAEDIRNNSAWNQRYFVISQTSGFTEEVIEKEIEYAKKALGKVLGNESAWNYLRGVCQHSHSGLSQMPGLTDWCEQLIKDKRDTPPLLLGFYIDIIDSRLDASPSEDVRKHLLNKAAQICEQLVGEKDKIRKNYWRFILQNLWRKYGKQEV